VQNLKRGQIILCLTIFALQIHAVEFAKVMHRIKPSQVEILFGYQRQSLDWSIAGNIRGQNPNILSHLAWSNLDCINMELNLKFQMDKLWVFEIPIHVNYVISGTVTDSDFKEDDRKDRIFYAEASARGTHGYSFRPQLGPRFALHPDLRLTLYLNYSILSDTYYLRDVFSERATLNSHYQTQWHGPGSSLEGTYTIGRQISIVGLINYSIFNYSAEADWNLVDSFSHPVSFSHKARGFGYSPSLKLIYNKDTSLSFILNLACTHMHTGKGIDVLYKADGSTIKTMLNSVILNGYSFKTGIVYFF